MKAIGIDVGTTTVCGIVMDAENGKIVDVQTLSNDSVIKGESFEWLQDPNRIWELVHQMYQDFLGKHSDICSIGLTGQMHGIVYIDAEGHSVGPLYTWQDERGNLEMEDGKTYAEYHCTRRCSGHVHYPRLRGNAADRQKDTSAQRFRRGKPWML